MELILSGQSIIVNGKRIPRVCGGFGTNQPTILGKQVAEIHDCQVKQINRIVVNNSDWFEEWIDYIDLKVIISKGYSGVLSKHPWETEENTVFLVDKISSFLMESGFYPNSQSIGGAQHIYLFSQQGYAMLCKFMKSNLAKQIYRQMVREYFQMAEVASPINELNLTRMADQLTDNAEQLVAQARILKVAVAEMYRNKEQIAINRDNISKHYEHIIDFDRRLSNLEQKNLTKSSNEFAKEKNQQADSSEYITAEQIEILKKKVKEKGRPITIWKRFNKAFEITRYKFLPENRFQEALEWIENLGTQPKIEI